MDDPTTTGDGEDEGKTTVTVEWRWAYETGANADEIATNDATDTGFGIDASDVEVTAELVVSQKD